MRRKLIAMVALGAVIFAYAVLADGATYDIREVQQIRERLDQVGPAGPHGPPRLVPPRAPGPAVPA